MSDMPKIERVRFVMECPTCSLPFNNCKCVPWWEQAVRDFASAHGPSGEAWNISAMLDCLRKAENAA